MRCFTLQRCEIRTAASLLWNAAPGEASSGSPDPVILRRQRRRRRRRWTTTGCGSDGNKVPNFPSGTVRWCLTGRYGAVRCGAVRCGTVPTVWTLLAHPWMPARSLAIRARQAWKGRRDWGAASAKTSLSPAAASLARRDWQWLPLRHGQGWRAPTHTAGQLKAGGGGCSSSARLGVGAPWSLGSSVGDHQAPTSEPAGTTMVVQTARLSGWGARARRAPRSRSRAPGHHPGRGWKQVDDRRSFCRVLLGIQNTPSSERRLPSDWLAG